MADKTLSVVYKHIINGLICIDYEGLRVYLQPAALF